MDNPELEKLRKEFEAFRKATKKYFDEKDAEIHTLKNKVKTLEQEQTKTVQYINRMLQKADQLIKKTAESLRRTQVIDRQKLNDLDSEVSNLSRRK